MLTDFVVPEQGTMSSVTGCSSSPPGTPQFSLLMGRTHEQPEVAWAALVYIIHLLVNIPLKSATILKKIMIALLGQAELATFILKKVQIC